VCRQVGLRLGDGGSGRECGAGFLGFPDSNSVECCVGELIRQRFGEQRVALRCDVLDGRVGVREC